MPKLKRDVVKYVRDKAKSKYAKGSACEICSETEQLDFHHFLQSNALAESMVDKRTNTILNTFNHFGMTL